MWRIGVEVANSLDEGDNKVARILDLTADSLSFQMQNSLGGISKTEHLYNYENDNLLPAKNAAVVVATQNGIATLIVNNWRGLSLWIHSLAILEKFRFDFPQYYDVVLKFVAEANLMTAKGNSDWVVDKLFTYFKELPQNSSLWGILYEVLTCIFDYNFILQLYYSPLWQSYFDNKMTAEVRKIIYSRFIQDYAENNRILFNVRPNYAESILSPTPDPFGMFIIKHYVLLLLYEGAVSQVRSFMELSKLLSTSSIATLMLRLKKDGRLLALYPHASECQTFGDLFLLRLTEEEVFE